ncbi:MAG: CHAT domain-containing protein [Gaiellales bacterium]
MALAGALAQQGHIDRAIQEVEEATTELDPDGKARAEVFRLGLLYYSERPYTERKRSAAAIARFRTRAEPLWEARLHYNRGLLRTARGDVRGSLTDLGRARDLYREVGADTAAVDAELAIADALGDTGDIPGALRALDAVEGDLPTTTLVDLELFRAKVLTQAMLLDDALSAVDRALAGMRDARSDRARRAILTRARILMLRGDHSSAARESRRVAGAFDRRGQEVAAARARVIALSAALNAGSWRRDDVVTAAADAALFTPDWPAEAFRAYVVLCAAAIRDRAIDQARHHLGEAMAVMSQPPLEERLYAMELAAEIKLLEGSPRRAAALASEGLRLLDRYRLTLGSVELRARASARGRALATLGLRLALAKGSARTLLGWTERLRANALLIRPERAVDAETTAAQNELRRIERALEDPLGAPEAARLRRRRAALEKRINQRSRSLPGTERAANRRTSVPELLHALEGRALVELVTIDGLLHALVARNRRVSHIPLGRLDTISNQLGWLRFGLRQLARSDLSRARRAAAAVGVTRDIELLDAELLQPLIALLGDADLVLVPSAVLAAIPWSVLPSLDGRAVSVVPSATLWHRLGEDRSRPGRGVAVIAGPGLRHARREVASIATIYGDATVVTGRRATVDEALAAVGGVRLAHLATHGRFRSDSPLFSSFELADGSLSAHELCALEHPPEILVLSACDLALSDAHPGDELLGLATTLLGLGTRTIIASVAPVSDRTTPRLMRTLHQELARGTSPARALAIAQSRHRDDPSAGSFVCMGRG